MEPSATYSTLWKAIIRPPRSEYDPLKDLGPPVFNLPSQITVQRTDLTLTNPRNQLLHCSLFEPCTTNKNKVPCVVYLHGNCSSRVEALDIVPSLLSRHVSVFCFDFAGCGKSEGDYISLGWHERGDLACVIKFLRTEKQVERIGVWGRSMGAVTALMMSEWENNITGMVLDSPFSDLKTLAVELCKGYKSHLPTVIVKTGLKMIRRSVKKRAKFDIYKVSPILQVADIKIPALFMVAT